MLVPDPATLRQPLYEGRGFPLGRSPPASLNNSFLPPCNALRKAWVCESQALRPDPAMADLMCRAASFGPSA